MVQKRCSKISHRHVEEGRETTQDQENDNNDDDEDDKVKQRSWQETALHTHFLTLMLFCRKMDLERAKGGREGRREGGLREGVPV